MPSERLLKCRRNLHERIAACAKEDGAEYYRQRARYRLLRHATTPRLSAERAWAASKADPPRRCKNPYPDKVIRRGLR